VGLYGSEVVSLWGCCFWTDGLVYDIKAVLSLLMEWMRFSMKQASSSLFLDKDHFLV